MKKLVSIFITIILVASLFMVCSVRAYTDSENRFSITPPQDWTAQDGVQGVVVQFLGPDDFDVGYVNINIAIQNTDQTLQAVVDNSKQSWASAYADYSLTNEEAVTVNGCNGHEIELSASDNGTQFMEDTVLFVQNGLLYQVSYIAGPETYDTYFDDWASSLDTFQILASPSPSLFTSQSSSPSESPIVDFRFNFSITGLPFILLIVAVIIIIIVIVAVVTRKRKPKNVPAKIFPPPPPPPP